MEGCNENLIQLLDRTNDTESEELHKNLVIDFLKKISYESNHFLNTVKEKSVSFLTALWFGKRVDGHTRMFLKQIKFIKIKN